MGPQDFSIETVSPMQPNSVWIDDGLMYINLNQPFNMENIQQVNQEGNAQRESAGLSHVPCIIIFTNKGKSLDLSLTDLSKVTVSATLEALSTIVIVGLEGASLQLAKLASRITFNNKLLFCNTLEEARAAAEPFRGTNKSILDRDIF